MCRKHQDFKSHNVFYQSKNPRRKDNSLKIILKNSKTKNQNPSKNMTITQIYD